MATLPWWVVGESGAVERAVTNLLDNAAKWGPADGTITVRLANGVLTVDDQGPGIEPGRPAARVRALLPLARVALDAGLGARAWPSCTRSSSGTPATVTAGAAPGGGTRMTMWLPGNPVPLTIRGRRSTSPWCRRAATPSATALNPGP